MSRHIARPTPRTRPYHLRLDRLARRLLTGKPASLQIMWQTQLDLAELLRDIQISISSTNPKGKHDIEKWVDLVTLKQLLSDARRLGDAIVWIHFQSNEQKIYPLSENAHPGTDTKWDHGIAGAVSAASELSNQGWGFPVLHDITDCLRIGDISFTRPDKPVTTVEVKSAFQKPEDMTPDQAGPLLLIHVIVGSDTIPDIVTPNELLAWPMQSQRIDGDRGRVDRQIVRIDKARKRQIAPRNTVITDSSDPEGTSSWLFTPIPENHSSNWPALNRILRKARRIGYASEVLDDTFSCAAFYDKDGLTKDRFKRPEHLAFSHELESRGEDGDDHVFRVDLLPVPAQNHPQMFLPFYLYPIPFTSKQDLMFMRSSAMLITDLTRLAEIYPRSASYRALPNQ